MTNDISAAIERVRFAISTGEIEASRQADADILAICAFAAARLAEPAKRPDVVRNEAMSAGEVAALESKMEANAYAERHGWLGAFEPKGEPLSDAPCKVCGYDGPGYYQPDTHPCAGQPTHSAAPEPPADLVETVAHVIRWGDFTPMASAILAALAGRLVQPGMVAVPAEFLRGSGHNRDGESIMLVPRGHVAVPVEDLRVALALTPLRVYASRDVADAVARLRAAGGQPL